MSVRRTPTRFSTVEEVASVLRLSKMTVYRMVNAGEIPGYRVGRSVRIPTAAVWQYLRENTMGPWHVEQSVPAPPLDPSMTVSQYNALASAS